MEFSEQGLPDLGSPQLDCGGIIVSGQLAANGGKPLSSGEVFGRWPIITDEDKRAVMDVLESGDLWGQWGRNALALQKEWAAYVDTRHCLAVNSGTAALHIAVAAAGVGPGRLDTYNALRRGNARYLTERLARIPGIVPPHEPEGRTHVYHMCFVRFDPEAAGSSMPPRRFRMAVEKAMTAEGVPIGQWQTMLVPAQTLFKTKEGYGKGCPWKCPYAREVAYDLAEFPETAKLIDDYTNVPHVAPPNGLRAMKLVADAFEKVFGNVGEIEQVDLSEAESAIRGW